MFLFVLHNYVPARRASDACPWGGVGTLNVLSNQRAATHKALNNLYYTILSKPS